MARYIDAEKLKNEFCEACSTHKRYCMTVEQCRAKEKEQPDRKWCFKMRLIDKAPSADVGEVVRCKDCVMHEKGCPLDTHPYMTPDDGYCYKGKRKDDA